MILHSQFLCKGFPNLAWNHCSGVEIPCKGIDCAMKGDECFTMWICMGFTQVRRQTSSRRTRAVAGGCRAAILPATWGEGPGLLKSPSPHFGAWHNINFQPHFPREQTDTEGSPCSRECPANHAKRIMSLNEEEESPLLECSASGGSLRTTGMLGKSHTSKLRNVFSHFSYRNLTYFRSIFNPTQALHMTYGLL